MRIGIAGASASGIYTAMLTKRLHPEWEVVIFDQAAKIAKKIYATGNGHCNLLNAQIKPERYSNPSFVESVLKGRNADYWVDLLGQFGLATSRIGDLIYPLTYSASNYVESLRKILVSQGVEIHSETKIVDYRMVENGIMVETSSGLKEKFDRFVIATGGKSQKNLGSDGSMFEVLRRHGYQVVEPRPGLCPIKTIEAVKSLDGLRHKAEITLLKNGKKAYSERGEILFKKDGLSGIAIFNCSSYIARDRGENKYKVSMDLFPDLSLDELAAICEKAKKQFGEDYLSAVVEKPLADYLKRGKEDPIKRLKKLEFRFAELYPFEQSQVSVGGVSLNEIATGLASNREKGVYFVGEVLDVDGLCGGFNLSWCLVSAAEVGNSL